MVGCCWGAGSGMTSVEACRTYGQCLQVGEVGERERRSRAWRSVVTEVAERTLMSRSSIAEPRGSDAAGRRPQAEPELVLNFLPRSGHTVGGCSK